MNRISLNKSKSLYILGIDCGLTVTKAVVFAQNGEEIGCGSTRNVYNTPQPRWVERDMQDIWAGCVQAVRAALANANIEAKDIVAIGVTGHGDGIYLLDQHGEPVRPAILSLDSRAWDVLQSWQSTDIMDQALAISGQQPYQAAPATLLAWIKKHEPYVYEQIGSAMFCKDWIRFKLTGQIATDLTEASTSFTDVYTQQYSDEIFELYGLDELKCCVPPIIGSMEFAGKVNRLAADETGLVMGTPVATGLHDVDASSVGVGGTNPGQLTAIAGTFSINEVVSSKPVLGKEWACRSYVFPGRWMNMSISPASATNLEWFVREFCPDEIDKARQQNQSPFAFVNKEIESVLHEETRVFFLPFIYGSPHGEKASAAFLGLRGWHKRSHVLRAIYEGVVFNHKTHIQHLGTAFPMTEVRLSGGGSKSSIWSQMFADALNLPVIVTKAQENGALGTALCAGIAAGLYSSLEEAVNQAVHCVQTYQPTAEGNARLESAYQVYRNIVQSFTPIWEQME